jgi:hypothetical protein
VIATNQAFEQNKPKFNIYGEPKNIEPKPEHILTEDEKLRIQKEIEIVQRSNTSSKKKGAILQDLQNKLNDLDNQITY